MSTIKTEANKTKKKPTIKTIKPRQAAPSNQQIDEGMSVALSLVREISFRDLWSSTTEMIKDRHMKAIPQAVDPERYSEDQKEFKRAESELEKTLTTPEQLQALEQYRNAFDMRQFWGELATFYYACAFVQTIGGVSNRADGCRRP